MAMWKLDGHDVRVLRGALKRAKQARWLKRVQAVMLVALGQTPLEAARSTAQSRWSVYKWLARYGRRHRPEDLMDRPRSGRPKAARAMTLRRIRHEYQRDPLALGYMATEWTVPLLAGHLARRYRCPMSPRTLRRRMKSLGLAWKRPRHAYFIDPHRPQKKGRWSDA
jgi:transposase